MEVQVFQEKLMEIRRLASANNNVLTGAAVRDFFSGLNPDRDQLLQILKYLKLQGITIQGMEETEEDSGEKALETEVKRELSPEAKEYLKEYKSSLEWEFCSESAKDLFGRLEMGDDSARGELAELYLGVAADMAADLYCGEVLLADLIQEANLRLLMALKRETPRRKDDEWLRKEIRSGIQDFIHEQTERDFGDDCLVAKVQNLEQAVKDLTDDEDGKEQKFSVEDLAIILDMDLEEIKDVLRLTGDA